MIERRMYRKEFDYSYTLGAFPTFELFENRSEWVRALYIHSDCTVNIDKLKAICVEKDIPMIEDDKMFRILSPKGNCFLIGVFEKVEMNLDIDKSHVVLDHPSNHGNMGTILRSSIGFNMKDIAIIGETALDFYHPNVVRASMGAIFQTNIAYFESFSEYEETITKRDLYPFILDGATELSKLDKPKGKVSLIFGNEATGLDDFYKDIGTGVYIGHEDSIDSLNLPMAATIALYNFYSKDWL